MRLHAHRAMSEVPYEAFLILALGLCLSAMRRIWSGRSRMVSLLLVALAGLAAGLSILCKFNGLLGLMVIGCWGALALIAPRLSLMRKVALAGAAIVIAGVAVVVFIALNPAMTARPKGTLNRWCLVKPSENLWQRFRHMVEFRLDTSSGQKKKFSHNALETTKEKLKVFAVQGFGRFGPFGPSESNSKVRYEGQQDWGAVLWWPVVLFGLFHAIRLGRSQLREGRPPTAVAILIWAAVAWTVVAAYLPMAWDRYLLPIQGPNALLAAVGVSAIWDRLKAPLLAAWRRLYAPAVWVFVILWCSYAFFWHSRDWNTASRLMLTYAMVDRGTVSITGLDRQTGDKAEFDGQFYSDKLPGYSFLAALPYAYAKWILDLPSHPLDAPGDSPGIRYWWSDYWITLGTSGLLTAGAAALLVILARDLGCSPRAAALVGLAYGLSTPAYVYATLAYGHQASAFVLLGSFLLLWRNVPRREGLRIFLAGFLAAYASVIELQLAPVLGHSGTLSDGAVDPQPSPFRQALHLWAGSPHSDLPAPRLQPDRFSFALGHGLLPSRDRGICQAPQPQQPAGLDGAGLAKGRSPAVGSLPRTLVLCSDLATGRAGLGRLDGASPMEPGGCLDARGRGDLPGEPELSGVDGRMVERARGSLCR